MKSTNYEFLTNIRKLIVILGPTASGKSALAVRLAKKFNGEIISADSRQVYKGLNIGSGKITKKEMGGIPHHLLDVASPKRRFTIAQYRRLAIPAIAEIARREKLPILAGGSPFYIYSVVDNWAIPEVKPNYKLRKQLEKLTAEQLLRKLQKLDPRRAKTLRQSSGQAKNRRRLIRALEIVLTTKKPVPKLEKHPLPYPVLFLGIKKSKEELKKLIAKRIQKRLELKPNMIDEVKNLRHYSGLSWKRLEEFGLEYRFIAQYLQSRTKASLVRGKGKLSLEDMKEKLQKATVDFSRRQMAWFKKDKRIHWIKNSIEAHRYLRRFLKIS